ncbi:T9SS type A sorting domain-containing protein [Hymenobacter negativus]|uniref:T9SS type A sorting domain-containing protein n=1 Tax=Hymenobacter negativus TaxID=2795026 RepID=A0ABS3QGZ7_9BACT|nr:T9SS type A sorting domain-containing protein [Hymenobacter negativus]MBO2010263.1 T9SS type A sorting domain-containing protein [Hymenobacter negativus]
MTGGYFTGPTAPFSTLALAGPASGPTAFLASLTNPTLTATAAAQGNLSFTLAPNPARTAVAVQLPARPDAPTATLTLTDALGRTLRTAILTAAGLHQELDLRGLAPGLYTVQMRAANTVGYQRLVVE